MALSSNSIIHFTSSIESLKGILENNFKLSFCEETIRIHNRTVGLMVPMICFCDIPLSEVKIHISKYGRYGLGLTKEWAQKMGLNPVLYIEQDSNLSRSLNFSFEDNILHRNIDFDTWDERSKSALDIFRYIKNYQGDLCRRGKTEGNYRFSDEREWRYVPSIDLKSPMALPSKYYEKESNKEHVETVRKEIENLKLEFAPNDIKYIIIENDDEIAPIINLLKDTKGKKYTYHDVERLTTRILTTDQIETDI